MSTNFRFSSEQQKPQRRLGRRSLALSNNTTNITLNGTLNQTAKYTSEYTQKGSYEPSCASTPLPDHSKNKENIFLSSIKPALASSPKSARKAPYQRRLGRRSMALRNDIQSEKDSLNDSLTRMKSINSNLKLSDPKSQSEASVSQSQPSNGFSFLNLERYDFLRKYFPNPVSQQQPSPVKSFSNESIRRNLHANSPTKCESVESLLNGKSPEFKYESVLKKIRSTSPAKTEAKYNSLLKNIATKYESIAETSESPTVTIEPAEEENDDFLKKSLTGVHKLPESPAAMEISESKYGSFLGDVSPKEDTMVDKQNDRRYAESIPSDDQESEQVCKAYDKDDKGHNETFEMEDDQSFLFKTPLAPKYYKRDESAVAFKTPMSSVFSRFQNNDDNNDSFVENERTIMLQFKNEPTAVTDVEKDVMGNKLVTTTDMMPDSSACATTDQTTSGQTDITTCKNSTSSDSTCMTKDSTMVKQPATLQDFMLEQRKQLEMFVEEQAQQLSQFIRTQNESYNQFIANIGREEGSNQATRIVDSTLQKQDIPRIDITQHVESELQNILKENDSHTSLAEKTTLNSTADQTKCSSTGITSESEVVLESIDASVIQPSGSLEQSILTVSQIPCMSETNNTIFEDVDETYSFRPKTRQSMAFSNFKKNCSILKTPSRSRRSMANTTAVFTPGSLSVCIRDQLEALEDDEGKGIQF